MRLAHGKPVGAPQNVAPTVSVSCDPCQTIFMVKSGQNRRRLDAAPVEEMREAILAYIDAHNENGKPFRWTKAADEILDKMRRFGLRTQQVHGQ